MKKSSKSGMKPLISKELTELLNDNDNNDVIVSTDEFDKIIKDNHLKIQRFAFFKDLDLVIFILNNRRIIQRPLSSYPILEQAIEEKLNQYKVSDYGIHWPEIDADLSLRGLLLEETVKLAV
ncbi:DUF2442 domain-containing protein [Dyadobacter sp. NIV53]|uniref:DUF2442 domain-containing protein n=1 Tax=Dyadobacter sp. NIV53 TaxID=2861765 RepID=UPI001E5A394D|nr:DUF2442 domain-containing protein [Dyadobacter sp. NIV53]